MSMWLRIRCAIGLHKRLDLIQSFGSGKHVGCPDCGKQYGMHDGLRVIVPWGDQFNELYEFMGYDPQEATERWQASRKRRGVA